MVGREFVSIWKNARWSSMSKHSWVSKALWKETVITEW
jgi:hypothetical protein